MPQLASKLPSIHLTWQGGTSPPQDRSRNGKKHTIPKYLANLPAHVLLASTHTYASKILSELSQKKFNRPPPAGDDG